MDRDLQSVRGRIFNIQRFSIHDGPGVRTIVFLKGCPLRCRWCCNPESQNWQFETMKTGDKERSVGCDITVGEVLEEVRRDQVYYRRSGFGGMTLSGGECLAQPEFSEALLRAAKESGITTAIETTGYADWNVIAALLPYVDTVLMDVKHMDAEKHRMFTAQSNAVILENARRIAGVAKELIVRTPVIPTFNDTEEEIGAIARFAASLQTVRNMHLLPYHRIGSDKYAGLGRTYTMAYIQPPDKETMRRLLNAVNQTGLHGQIGG